MIAHNHTCSITSDGSEFGSNDASRGSGTRGNHNHGGSTTTSATSGGTLSNSVTYASTSNDPAYYTVIFIKSGGYSTIPNNAMIFSASTSRSGLSFHTGSANRFLKGAGTGANAGSTGGSSTHIHSLNHTHSAVNHTHTGTTASQVDDLSAGTGSQEHKSPHSHTYTLQNQALTGSAYSGDSPSLDFQPAFRTLNSFKNESGSSKMPAVGDIALWLGTLATIPVGWKLCDGTNSTPDMRGRYYKNPATASASSTGGANTHSHSASNSHSHGTTSHTHPNGRTDSSTQRVITGVGSYGAIYTHNHTMSVATANVSWNSATIASDSSSNEPEYRTVAFIQFEYAPVIPNPILGMLIDKL